MRTDTITARCPGCGIEFNAADIAGMDACPVCSRPFQAMAGDVGDMRQPDPDATTAFVNPANGHTERIDGAWLWVLLFGCIYFAFKGVWTHAVVSLAAAMLTGGLSWLVYPFFAGRILRTHYLRKGWKAA